jgi:hypothetical protein
VGVVEGEVEEEKVKVGQRAAQGPGCSKKQAVPCISDPRTLGEKMQNGLRGRSTPRTGRGRGEAEAVASGLEGENIVKGRKAHIH